MNAQTKAPVVLEVSDSTIPTVSASALRAADIDVVRAADGATALAIARQSVPDVVLLDMTHREIDGYEITRRLRADEVTAGIPVVHTSDGRATGRGKQDSFAAGADAYIAHPVDAHEIVGVCSSLARLRRAEVTALRRAEAMRVDNQKKDEFIAMLSHEMRGPLSVIRTGLALLETGGPDRDRAARVRTRIVRQTERLVRLVDDLLDVARIAHGKVRLDAVPVDLGQVVASAVEAARPSFERQGVDLSVDGETGVVIDGESSRLEQIVANLLDNALKYTPAGGQVEVTISVVEEEPRRARLRVKDSGIGIDKKHIDGGLFTLFAQGDTSFARRDGGLGVGLAVVQRLVEIHGGTVRVSSDGLGLGTELEIHFPLPPSVRSNAPVGPDRPQRAVAGDSTRVLLVDDHADTCALFEEILRREGHEVAIASDGEAALALLVAETFDVAVIDIGLPGLDGHEVARMTRERLGDAAPLFVAITGYDGPDERDASERAGFAVHLVKPLDPSALVAAIAARVGRVGTGARALTSTAARRSG